MTIPSIVVAVATATFCSSLSVSLRSTLPLPLPLSMSMEQQQEQQEQHQQNHHHQQQQQQTSSQWSISTTAHHHNNYNYNNNHTKRPRQAHMYYGFRRRRQASSLSLSSSSSLSFLKQNSVVPLFLTRTSQDTLEYDNDNDNNDNNNNTNNNINEKTFLRRELDHLEALEELLKELEGYDLIQGEDDDKDDLVADVDDVDVDDEEDDVDDDDDDDDLDPESMEELNVHGSFLWDEESLQELLQSVVDDDDDDDDDEEEEDTTQKRETTTTANSKSASASVSVRAAAAGLEQALLQGVVPVSANVGSECLPGDWGFDPLNLATKDYFRQTQSILLRLVTVTVPPLPLSRHQEDHQEEEEDQQQQQQQPQQRPKALILRDYREAEIRHGRLAMLAAVIWPLQERLDEFVFTDYYYNNNNYNYNYESQPLWTTHITLPYFPLLMTAIMMLLGYLDVFSQAIKDRDQLGEAFLPGDCFWDPLRMLQGAPDRMKRNMQERELFNGRVAMLAVAVFGWEEAVTHLPLIHIEGNDLLLEPAYQVPFIQHWLDAQFAAAGSMSL